MSKVAAWRMVVVAGVVVIVVSAVITTVQNMPDVDLDTASTKVEANYLSLGSPQPCKTKTDGDIETDHEQNQAEWDRSNNCERNAQNTEKVNNRRGAGARFVCRAFF